MDDGNKDAEAPALTQRRKKSPLIVITDEMRAQLNTEFERTKATAKILSRLWPSSIRLLHDSVLTRWRNGSAIRARKDQWVQAQICLASLPDANMNPELIAAQERDRQKKRNEPRATQPAKKQRRLVVKERKPCAPSLSDLSPQTWPPKPQWTRNDTISARYKDTGMYVPVSRSYFLALHREVRRTSISPRKLLSIFDKPPEGLRFNMIGNWLRLTTRSAQPEYLEWVLDAYKLLPDGSQE
ncbi:MAG: hypothetical protein AAFR51_03970 [Pseudomonadota bacterium]